MNYKYLTNVNRKYIKNHMTLRDIAKNGNKMRIALTNEQQRLYIHLKSSTRDKRDF